jgi:hypothetical protein
MQVSEFLRPVYDTQLFTLSYSKYFICPPPAWIQASAQHIIATWRWSQIPGMLCIVWKPATVQFWRVLRVTKPVHTADDRDATVVLAILSRWSSEWHPLVVDTLCILIPEVSFTTSRISSCTSWVIYLGHPLLATWGEVQYSHIHKSSDEYFSFLDIFILDTFLGTNDEPPQHYHPPNCTWNVFRLALDLSALSQQLAITRHVTHNYCKKKTPWP